MPSLPAWAEFRWSLEACAIDTRSMRAQELAMTEDVNRRFLEGVAKVALSALHKVNNNLSGITCSLSMVQEELSAGVSEDASEIIGDALLAANDVSGHLNKVLPLFRMNADDFEAQELNGVVGAIVETTFIDVDFQGSVSTTWAKEPLSVHSSFDWMRLMVEPVLVNATEAVAPDGRIEVSTELRVPAGEALLDPLPKKGHAVLIVRDSGDGFDEELGADLFLPFNSTKSRGRGLGLAFSLLFARAHGGTMGWRNLPDGGAEVTIWLPSL